MSGDDAFSALVRHKARASGALTAVLCILLALNLFLLSNGADIGAQAVFEKSSVSLGLAVIVVTIVASALLSFVYVWWANRKLDGLAARARDEYEKNSQAS